MIVIELHDVNRNLRVTNPLIKDKLNVTPFIYSGNAFLDIIKTVYISFGIC